MAFGVRQRRPPPRVTIRPSATGWSVVNRRAKAVEVLCPREGGPQLSLFLAGKRLAALTHLAGRPVVSAPETPATAQLFRVRHQAPSITEGPVFGTLRTVYHYVDRDGATLWAETYLLRFFACSPESLLADLSIEWHALAGSVPLGELTGNRRENLPVLRVESTRGDQAWVAGPGWSGRTEIGDRPAAMVLRASQTTSLTLLCSSTSFGFPPLWSVDEHDVLYSRPYLSNVALGSGNARLPLGERVTVRYRLWGFTAGATSGFARERYLDFDCPPVVKSLSSDT